MRVFGTLLVAAFVSVVVVATGAAIVSRINQLEEVFVATKDDVTAAIQRLQDTTTAALARVAEDVQHLRDELAAGGEVTAADLDGIVASINGVSDQLAGEDPDPSFPPPAG